jgi:hypothetical protein
MKDFPDHHDAELALTLYDLRRESLLRESRGHMNQWFPRTLDEVVAVTKPEHPLNAAFRQVSGYWDMAFNMARHGVIHADFLAEMSGEGLYFYSKIERFVEELRTVTGPRAFRNAQWVATNTDMGREMMPVYRARIEKALAG